MERGAAGGRRGWLGHVLKPKQYARLSKEVIYEKATPTHRRACGTNKISKYVNSFLCKIPTILILSFLVSEF